MKKYLAFDSINCDYEEFENIEDAKKWLEECFYDSSEGYHPDIKDCKIYELCATVDYDVLDSKSNYKYVYEDDIPEDDNESEAWPYNSGFDEIWEHKWVNVDRDNK